MTASGDLRAAAQMVLAATPRRSSAVVVTWTPTVDGRRRRCPRTCRRRRWPRSAHVPAVRRRDNVGIVDAAVRVVRGDVRNGNDRVRHVVWRRVAASCVAPPKRSRFCWFVLRPAFRRATMTSCRSQTMSKHRGYDDRPSQ